MKLVTKIIAGVLLGFGLMITLAVLVDLANPSSVNKEGALEAQIFLGLPALAIGGGMIWNARRHYLQAERERLRSAFFRLLTANRGQITPLRFAMETGLDGTAAKTYLDARAKEFNAIYKVSEEGNMTYSFHLGSDTPNS